MFELDVGEFQAALVDPFDEIDNGAGGLFGGDGEQRAIVAEMSFRAFGMGRRLFRGERCGEANLNAG